MSPYISVIVPVGTEPDITFYKRMHTQLANDSHASKEIIWVSNNRPLNKWLSAQPNTIRLEPADKKTSRGKKMQLGLERAAGKICLFHHPRSLLPNGGLKELTEAYQSAREQDLFWGGFTHTFFEPTTRMHRFTSWYSNHVRGDKNHVLYLDHCMFASRQLLLESGGVPDEPVFEDTLLSYRLREKGNYTRLQSKAPTSSVRFKKNGFWLQSAINFLSKALFTLGVKPRVIYRIYEYRNRLN